MSSGDFTKRLCSPQQDFDSVELAMALMESDGRDELHLGGSYLGFEYSVSPQPALAAAGAAAAAAAAASTLDWICSMCQAVNFSR